MEVHFRVGLVKIIVLIDGKVGAYIWKKDEKEAQTKTYITGVVQTSRQVYLLIWLPRKHVRDGRRASTPDPLRGSPQVRSIRRSSGCPWLAGRGSCQDPDHFMGLKTIQVTVAKTWVTWD